MTQQYVVNTPCELELRGSQRPPRLPHPRHGPPTQGEADGEPRSRGRSTLSHQGQGPIWNRVAARNKEDRRSLWVALLQRTQTMAVSAPEEGQAAQVGHAEWNGTAVSDFKVKWTPWWEVRKPNQRFRRPGRDAFSPRQGTGGYK